MKCPESQFVHCRRGGAQFPSVDRAGSRMKRQLRRFACPRPLAFRSRHVNRPWLRAAVSRTRRQSACGPLPTLAFVALWRCLADCVACRVPPRRAGNFHLEAQIKVTKAKGLNTTPLMRSARCGAPAQRATWRQSSTSDLQRTRRRGLREASPAQIRWTQGQSEARPRRVHCRLDPQRALPVARRAGRARREERAEWFCIEPLCFGDFYLGPQMKVTRPPGRDPAGWQSAKHLQSALSANGRNGPQAASRTPAVFHSFRVARSAMDH